MLHYITQFYSVAFKLLLPFSQTVQYVIFFYSRNSLTFEDLRTIAPLQLPKNTAVSPHLKGFAGRRNKTANFMNI